MKFFKYTILSTLLTVSLGSCSEEPKEESQPVQTTDSKENITFENAVSTTPENPNATHFSIQGTLAEGKDQKLFLYFFSGQQPSIIDSTVIQADHTFKLEGKGEGYQFYGVGSSPKKLKLLLLNSTEQVTLSGDYNLISKADIDGSADSKILDNYTNQKQEFYTKMQELQNKIQSFPQNTNSPERNALLKESEALTIEFTKFVTNFIDQNIESPAILSTTGDLFDPNSQMVYLKKIENTLAKTMNNSIYHNSLKANIAKLQQQMTMQQPKQNGNAQVGMQAQELNFPSPSGEKIALSSLRGKVVLIDFWASWCKPCRMENPNVVRLYNEYKDKGFTVYSVSLDKDKGRWENAIKQDGLVWPNHVSDLKGWQSAASALYGVNGIPYTVLIDKDGKVIATSLRGIQLEQKLKEILG
ncbi:MAG: AhpC/TSA family protein [Flavobacteriales bacterium]|jgi:thiol-disulfide isomerase/thioredoxin|nr:AhpC/TSA family protein [Flavobacteriales bacterium]